MGRIYEEISEHHREWIARQSMFFVATAPLSGDGHVNVSPKGPIGSFQVLGPCRVAYLDVGGSGAETIAHLRENGRIVVMFCAFDGPPRILRLHGRGRAVIRTDPEFDALCATAPFTDPSIPEARRSLIVVDVARVSDSCGYGVPLMSFEGLREHHALSSAKRVRRVGEDGYWQHRLDANGVSIDGLPALDPDAP